MTAPLLSPLKQAFLALQDAQERIAALEAEKNEAIAVIGLGCRIPQVYDTSSEGFWRLLADHQSAISGGLAKRWREVGALADGVPARANCAALLEAPEEFDAEFFGISPREAAGMDPQQRLLTEVSWEALEHAGIAPTTVYGSDTGVFIGISTSDYLMLRLSATPLSDIDGHFGSGCAHSVASGRISYLFGLRGPSLSIDTACSSSLVAVHLAGEALRRGECSLALAGGVNLILSTEASRTFAQAGMLASDGRCKAFAASADGFVRGEGCGIVVLKRLGDAEAAGDRILAVIRGSAVNHDGPSSGLTVPNGLAQQALIRRALKAAGVAPEDVSYVEAHGTGTSLGDPIEAEALGAVMGRGRSSESPLLIGSVKTNIGHLEAAAGVAGLIKVVLALGHGELPGQLHWDTPSPHIRWDALKLRVVDRLRAWEPIKGRRIAGVSSFGFSGTNAHVVVEAAPAVAADTTEVERPLDILPIAAKSEGALRVLAERYVERLRSPALDWADLCHTAAVGRAQFGHRLSVRARDSAEGCAALEAFVAGQPHSALIQNATKPGNRRPRVGLLFTGQGSQYAGMGRALHACSPSFRRFVERAEAVLSDRLEVPLGAVMRGEHQQAPELLNQTLYTQPALYVLEYALAELWRGLGVQPVGVLGHSLGEYVACAFAGVFDFEDGLRLVADRARLMHELASNGAMLVVAASEAEVAELLAGHTAEVSLAGINAARQVTVSGTRGAVEAIAAACTARGWRSQMLPVSQAFHSPLMEPIGAAFEARAGEVVYAAPRLPVISNLTGVPLEMVNAGYWRAHMRQAVRFSQGLEALGALGCDVLIEIGPRPVLIQLARQAAGGQPQRRYLTSLKGPGTDEWDIFCLAVQELYAAGAEIDWTGWNRDYRRHKVDAPLYPFERRRHWISPSLNLPVPSRGRIGVPAHHVLLGTRLRSALAGVQFDADLAAAGETAWLAEHRIAGQAIIPATGLIEMMLAAGEAMGPQWRALEAMSIVTPLCLPSEGTRTVQTVVDVPQDGRARVRVFAAEADGAGIEAPAEAQGHLRFRLHAEARLAPVEDLAGEGTVDLAGLRSHCTRSIDGEAHYRHLAARAADFGPAFHGVQHVWVGDNEAVGEVTVLLPPIAGDRPHPAALDACLQVAAGILADSADTFMPVMLDRFECLATSWPQHLLVHARLAGPDRIRPEFDFTVHDAEGKTLARFHRLQFRKTTTTTVNESLPQSWFYEIGWRSMPAESSGEAPADWIVVGSCGIAEAVAAGIRAAGKKSTLSSPAANELERALAKGGLRKGVVYVPPDQEGNAFDLGPMSAKPAVEQLLELCHRHAADALLTNSRLYVVTRKVHAAQPNETTCLVDAAISGLAATVLNEFPELRCTRIDIDPTDVAQAGRNVALEALANAADDWVAYRGARRLVPRLQRSTHIRHCALEDQGPVSLVCEHGLDGLNWRSMQQGMLEPAQLEIEVHAAALNFRDVMGVVGLIPQREPLGSECAGVVTRIGRAVKGFKPGDAVVAITPGSFASIVIAPECRTIAKPTELSFETASAQGLVYLTADHCLNEIARMRAGERVLIHAAAGGVGLAAVQLCHRAGVQIYATAGSDAKRAHLHALGIEHVFSSRSLDFITEIKRLTGGAGVDIVLNSLTGAFVDAGLSVLARGGRFIEIGKTDIRDKATVAAARPDVVYEPVDLTHRLREQPERSMARISELFALMAAGELRPVPHRSYEFRDAKIAFRELASSSHVGKLVLTPGPRPLVHAEGAYIVTGGAASIGFAAAEWLAKQGAGRVILLSRRSPAPDIAARIASWREKGIEMVAIQGDAGDRSTIAAAIAGAGAALRGVIHCANILDDAPLGDLSWDRFEKVMHPKAEGAWHLHCETVGRELDFFVLFSSWASIAGKRGGANYAAASVALDSLAHLRRSQGLPALSLDWGAWADIGWAARLGESMPAWEGFGAMKPDLAFDAMAFAIRDGRSAQLAIAPVDWSRLMGRSLSSVFSEFGQHPEADRSPAAANRLASLRDVIASVSHAAMRPAVVKHLQVMAAAALGFEGPEKIDPEQPLQDMGLDSIMAVELRNTLAHSLGRPLPTPLLFDHPTLNSLADFTIGLIAPKGPDVVLPQPQKQSDDPLTLIEGLSDEEVDTRLSDRTAKAESL